MTLDKWLANLVCFLSGRTGLDRRIVPPEKPKVDLPEIEPPGRVVTRDGKDKAHLEQKRREHDIELARLRAIAHIRGIRRDA